MSLTLNPPLPCRAADCPPAEALEEAAGSEAPPGVELHLAGCASCRGYVETLRAESTRFVAARPPELFLAQLERRPSRPRRAAWLRPALVAGAAAVGVLVLVAAPHDPLPAVTFKGAQVTVHVRRGAVQQTVSEGDALHPEDAVRFVVRSEKPGFAAVFERDPAGKVTVVAPFAATRPAPIVAGSTELPDSAVLDDSTGAEWFVAVTSPEPFDLTALRNQLEAQAAAGPPKLDCAGCKVDALRFEKRP